MTIVMRIREYESKHVQHSWMHYERQWPVYDERIVDRRHTFDDMHWLLELHKVVHQCIASSEQF